MRIPVIKSILISALLFFVHVNRVAADSLGLPGGLINPLEADSIEGLLLSILDILLVFAMPVILFFIVYSGFKFVTAQGNATQISEARSAFMWAIVGGVIILGAKLLVDVIQGTVDAL